MKHNPGRRRSWYVVLCLSQLLAFGCATRRTVGPSSAVPAQPPLAAEAPVELPPPIGPILAPGQVLERMPGGVVDWSGKTVAARGTGVLDPGNSNRDQAWQMAERAANVVARSGSSTRSSRSRSTISSTCASIRFAIAHAIGISVPRSRPNPGSPANHRFERVS